jgi:hypothetical protein
MDKVWILEIQFVYQELVVGDEEVNLAAYSLN